MSYQLHQNIVVDDWSSRRMEIDKQIAYFIAGEDWRGEYDIKDQDVLNLIAAYNLKANIELFVKDPKARWFDEKLLLPINASLASEKNHTAKYLRILFTSYRQQSLSTEQGLFIEDQDHNYFDRNLHELLVGMAFYSLTDQVKAEKHFEKLTNNYSNLVKPLMMERHVTKLRSAQVTKVKPRPSFNFDGKTIMRLVILAAVGIGLLSNIFSNDDDYYDYSSDYDVEDEYDDEYADLEFPDELDLGFATYFFSKEDRPDSYDVQTDYIYNYVSDDVRSYFEDYRDRYDELTLDWIEDETDIHYARLAEGKEAYLYSDQQQQDVILYVTDESLITRVVGEYWEEIDIAEYNELLKVFNRTPEKTQEVLSQSFYLLPETERADHYSELRTVVTADIYDKLTDSYYYFDNDELVGGTYQISQNQEDETVLLLNNKVGELKFFFTLDNYGRVSVIDPPGYDEDGDANLIKVAGEKRPLSMPK